MREILFRGKRTDNGEWVFGYYTELPEGDIGGTLMAGADELLCEDTADYIISIETKQCQSFSPAYPIQVFDVDWCKVRHQTVGQYTGIKDKNGKKIFEGDIVQYQPEYWCEPLQSVVEYYADKWNYPAFDLKDHDYEANGLQCAHEEGGCEVIGNIHDNPELLEVEE